MDTTAEERKSYLGGYCPQGGGAQEDARRGEKDQAGSNRRLFGTGSREGRISSGSGSSSERAACC